MAAFLLILFVFLYLSCFCTQFLVFNREIVIDARKMPQEVYFGLLEWLVELDSAPRELSDSTRIMCICWNLSQIKWRVAVIKTADTTFLYYLLWNIHFVGPKKLIFSFVFTILILRTKRTKMMMARLLERSCFSRYIIHIREKSWDFLWRNDGWVRKTQSFKSKWWTKWILMI